MFGGGVDALGAAGFGTKESGGALQDEVRTKILGADFVVGGQFLRGSALENRTLVQKVRPVYDCEGLSHVVVCDDNSDILVFELGDDILDILDSNRVHTGKRLIEQDEFRVYGKCACNLATAALSSGKLDSLALADLMKIELVKLR